MAFRELQQQHPRGVERQHVLGIQDEKPGQQQDSPGPSREPKREPKEGDREFLVRSVKHRLIHEHLSMGQIK